MATSQGTPASGAVAFQYDVCVHQESAQNDAPCGASHVDLGGDPVGGEQVSQIIDREIQQFCGASNG